MMNQANRHRQNEGPIEQGTESNQGVDSFPPVILVELPLANENTSEISQWSNTL